MINPANPVGAFLQGNQLAQQQVGQQQDRQMRQRQFGMQEAQFNQQQADREREQRLALAGEIAEGAAWVLQDPAQAPQRFAQMQEFFRPIFGDAVNEVTLEQLPMLQAQLQRELQGATPSGYRPTEDGNLTYIPGGPADPNAPRRPEPQTAMQRDAEWYLNLPEEQRAEVDRMRRGEPRPSSAMENRLFEVNDAAFRARANVGRYNNLADELVRVDPQGGVVGAWTERLKAITGEEDAVTLLRQQWNELRVSNAIQNLPPGVASDKDIELVMSAFLPEFANAETIASFMRGLAKIEELRADYHEFEAEYLSDRGSAVGLNRAWRDLLAERTAGQSDGGQGGQQGGLEIGTVQDGYRYLGGDPANPNSWERAR